MTLASLRKQIGIVQQDVFYSWNITRKYCLWEFKCYRNRHSTSGEISTFRTCNSANARWLGHNYWRTWREIIGRSKAASGNCANVLEEPADFNLDEATSALDTETEQVIQESLNSLADGRTTLIIAHRLATIKHADRIIVVSDQGILEDGTHETLYAQRGHYRRLYDAQFRT